MKKAIFKYKLKFKGHEALIDLPFNADILKIEMQGNEMMLWAIVMPEHEQLEGRIIKLYGTGHTIPVSTEDLTYINTVFHGSLVWHLFEFGRPRR